MLKINRNHFNQSTYSLTNLHAGFGEAIWLVDFSCLLNIILTLIGMIGNFICACVFTQKKMRTNNLNYCFLITALFELVFCALIFIDNIWRCLSQKKLFLHELNEYLEIIIDFIVHTIDSNTGFLTLVLSIDRLRVIKNNREKNFKISKCFILYLILIVTLIELISFTLCFEFRSISTFNVSYCAIGKPFVFSIIPNVLNLTLNLLLLRRLFEHCRNKYKEIKYFFGKIRRSGMLKDLSLIVCKRNRNGSELSIESYQFSCSSLHVKNACAIISIAIWAVLATIPYYTSHSLSILNDHDILKNSFNTNIIVKILAVSAVFFNLNHCINFFVYLSTSKEFKSFFNFLKFSLL